MNAENETPESANRIFHMRYAILAILAIIVLIMILYDIWINEADASISAFTDKDMHLKPKNDRRKKIIRTSVDGVIRGVLMGTITGGGASGAIVYGVTLGIINPFVMIATDYI